MNLLLIPSLNQIVTQADFEVKVTQMCLFWAHISQFLIERLENIHESHLHTSVRIEGNQLHGANDNIPELLTLKMKGIKLRCQLIINHSRPVWNETQCRFTLGCSPHPLPMRSLRKLMRSGAGWRANQKLNDQYEKAVVYRLLFNSFAICRR